VSCFTQYARSTPGKPQPLGDAVTTEIAVMNRHGIALAADSAVTIGRDRVWKTANKLFSLGPHNDIAIMTFGSGDFLSIPWETIVKTFRAKNGANRFNTVKDCANAFIEYLKCGSFKDKTQERISILLLFVHQIHQLKQMLKNRNYKTTMDFRTQLDECINILREKNEKRDITVFDADEKTLANDYAATITEFAKDEFERHITKALLSKLVHLCFEAFRREVASSYETGIVIAGFGENEFFPCVVTYIVDGFDTGKLRAWIDDDYSDDLNAPDNAGGIIIPFGQDDIATLFLQGIANSHLRWINKALITILDDKSDKLCAAYIKDEGERLVEQRLQRTSNAELIKLLREEFTNYRKNSLVQKIMEVVSSLPKEEMAVLAESLVELTSLRRKMDSKVESVGGPTDVAIISKGDGLIWINRKHYFDISLNGDYSIRKILRLSSGESYETRTAPAGEQPRIIGSLGSAADSSGSRTGQPKNRLTRGGGRPRRSADNQKGRGTTQ
jgi:hypothetical protein